MSPRKTTGDRERLSADVDSVPKSGSDWIGTASAVAVLAFGLPGAAAFGLAGFGVLLAEGDTLRPSDLNLRPPGEGASRLEDMSLEEVGRVLIQKALTRFEGNVSAAAKALGLSRSALYRRLQRHSL